MKSRVFELTFTSFLIFFLFFTKLSMFQFLTIFVSKLYFFYFCLYANFWNLEEKCLLSSVRIGNNRCTIRFEILRAVSYQINVKILQKIFPRFHDFIPSFQSELERMFFVRFYKIMERYHQNQIQEKFSIYSNISSPLLFLRVPQNVLICVRF